MCIYRGAMYFGNVLIHRSGEFSYFAKSHGAFTCCTNGQYTGMKSIFTMRLILEGREESPINSFFIDKSYSPIKQLVPHHDMYTDGTGKT